MTVAEAPGARVRWVAANAHGVLEVVTWKKEEVNHKKKKKKKTKTAMMMMMTMMIRRSHTRSSKDSHGDSMF